MNDFKERAAWLADRMVLAGKDIQDRRKVIIEAYLKTFADEVKAHHRKKEKRQLLEECCREICEECAKRIPIEWANGGKGMPVHKKNMIAYGICDAYKLQSLLRKKGLEGR
jgi:hypothetical protein